MEQGKNEVENEIVNILDSENDTKYLEKTLTYYFER